MQKHVSERYRSDRKEGIENGGDSNEDDKWMGESEEEEEGW